MVVALEELGLKGHGTALHEHARHAMSFFSPLLGSEASHPEASSGLCTGYHFKDARASANEHAKEHELPDYVVPIVEQLKQNTTACVLTSKTGTRHADMQSSAYWAHALLRKCAIALSLKAELRSWASP